MEELSFSDVSISVPWGHISGYSCGDPRGLKVLALHGWLDNSGTFFKLIPFLTKSIHMVAIDLPGHGRSSFKPPGSLYHFEEYLIDIQLVVEALGWNRFIFMGHSLGAEIASWYAGLFPDQVMAMVAIDMFGKNTSSSDFIVDTLAESLKNLDFSLTKFYPNFESAVKRLQNSYYKSDPAFTMEAARALCERGVVKVGDGLYKFTTDGQLKHPSIFFFRTSVPINRVYVRKIACQTLLVLFKQTHMPVDKILEATQLVPKEKIQVFEVDGGHHAHLYVPDTVAQIINPFLLSQTKQSKL